MAELFDGFLVKTFQKDKHIFARTRLPIVTLSASSKEDLKKAHGFPDDDTLPDVVFSRAHFTMALAIALTSWGTEPDPSKAWVVDPTNYVPHNKWHSVLLTYAVGKMVARVGFLHQLKNFIDAHWRQRLPIITSITAPLLHLTEHVKYPILSLHIAVGNILIGQGKRVMQVVTDPHVREEYVFFADQPHARFCVFDERTKTEFLEQAALHDKVVDPNHVIVTGPPLDPRIVAKRGKTQPWRSGPLNLCLTTGGLGTNKQEMLEIFRQLAPHLSASQTRYRLLIYVGTHQDLYEALRQIADENELIIDKPNERTARLRILYHPQLTDANDLLVEHGFGWAHGFITKPSADMTYEAVANGSFVLTLQPWGVWEEKIQAIFEQHSVSRACLTENIVAQLELLTSAQGKPQSWVEQAMNNALLTETIETKGAQKIIAAMQAFRTETT